MLWNNNVSSFLLPLIIRQSIIIEINLKLILGFILRLILITFFNILLLIRLLLISTIIVILIVCCLIFVNNFFIIVLIQILNSLELFLSLIHFLIYCLRILSVFIIIRVWIKVSISTCLSLFLKKIETWC